MILHIRIFANLWSRFVVEIREVAYRFSVDGKVFFMMGTLFKGLLNLPLVDSTDGQAGRIIDFRLMMEDPIDIEHLS